MPRPSSLDRRAAATPRVSVKGGNLYWQPSAALRAAGFAGQPLGPLSVAALNRADELNAAADDHLERQKHGRKPEARPAAMTMGAVFAAYRDSDYYAEKRASSRALYAKHLRVLEQDFGPELVAAVTSSAVEDWHREIARAHPRHASNIFRTLRLVLNWAVRRNLIASNPAQKIGARSPAPRRRIATRAELAALIAAADAMGRPSIGDFCTVAVCTMQRVEDVLSLTTAANLNSGVVHMVQGKTRRELTFRLHPAVTQRIPELLTQARPFVVSEETGTRYSYNNFANWFRRVRAAAAVECPSLLGRAPVTDPNLRGALWAEDFRRTGMVWAAQGGALIAEIVSVSGHEIGRGMAILETYLPRERLLADRALSLLDISAEPGITPGARRA